MKAAGLSILLIEDNPDHAKMIQHILKDVKGNGVALEWADRLSRGIERLNGDGIDAVLLDLGLPDSASSATLPKVLAYAPDTPIIVLTALDDMGLATKAVQQGAQDYLVKTQITGELLVRSIRYAIERKRAQAERERYAAELERSNAEFQQFAHVVSHDLKTPLSGIIYRGAILKNKPGRSADAETEDFIRHVVAAAQRMGRLIDDLLEYARVGSPGGSFEMIDSRVALDEAVANLQAEIDESGARVAYDNPLPTLPADDTQLVQIFQNLVGNAIKYRGDASPEVHVGARREGGDWLFSVRDNGIGISPEHAERIFIAFERLHGNEKYAGTGIGLATCKRIVERHGGRIWVESQPGQGSTFYFTLPVEQPV